MRFCQFYIFLLTRPPRPAQSIGPAISPTGSRRGRPMFYQTESKPQGWRAVALFDDERAEALVYLGRSSTQVRAGYAEADPQVLADEERAHVTAVELQRWHGPPDDGRWILQSQLKLP